MELLAYILARVIAGVLVALILQFLLGSKSGTAKQAGAVAAAL